ncbi:hypothetical protein [Pseudomonas sp. GD03944]|uniref:hypothetical protein n=1 Tax=Pseudomonas sp. GD03944 TaxID=2975409 RepID=UPI00244C097F|nr:hypothetical protein [Pseudomonas sp. GD03944]MDH1264268.1 hypothetical protein [Pseudomonas sp. GD03944]
MEFIVVSVAIAAIIAFVVFKFASGSAGTSGEIRYPFAGTNAHLTLKGVNQINRIATLRDGAPALALQLAGRLSGDAWQIAHASLGTALLQPGREEDALALLQRLDEPYRSHALEQLLQELVDRGQADKALALQTRIGGEPPRSPLLRGALALAAGNPDGARHELHGLAEDDSLSDLDRLTLARLQQACGLAEEAQSSISLVREALDSETPAIEWRPLMETLAALHHYPDLIALAALGEEHTRIVVELLMQGGQYTDALKLLAPLESPSTELLDYEAYLKQLLQDQRHDLAQQLLSSSQGSVHSILLEQYVDWHIQRNDSRQAQRLLDAEAQRLEPSSLNWLLLSLAERHDETQSYWASELIRQSERLISDHAGQPDEPFMRLLNLRFQLQAQARRSANQRDSWTIRRCLEDITQLIARMEPDDALTQRIHHSELLHTLGEHEQAMQCLQDARQQMEDDWALDKDMLEYHNDEIATALIKLGELDEAKRLIDQGKASRWLRHGLLDAVIAAGRLEDAIEQLDFSTLVGLDPESSLNQLYRRVHDLKDQDVPRQQRLEQRLFERLEEDATWRYDAQLAPQV